MVTYFDSRFILVFPRCVYSELRKIKDRYRSLCLCQNKQRKDGLFKVKTVIFSLKRLIFTSAYWVTPDFLPSLDEMCDNQNQEIHEIRFACHGQN